MQEVKSNSDKKKYVASMAGGHSSSSEEKIPPEINYVRDHGAAVAEANKVQIPILY